jgi:hypothetical protein
MLIARVRWAIFLLMIGCSVDARAQGHQTGDMFLAGRVGTNLVGNTYRVRETKPVAGAGASVGRFLAPSWALELEGWVRASNPECCHTGRETLISLSAVRLYARAGLQPYALGGVTLLRAAGAGRCWSAASDLPSHRDGRRSERKRRRLDHDRQADGGRHLLFPVKGHYER